MPVAVATRNTDRLAESQFVYGPLPDKFLFSIGTQSAASKFSSTEDAAVAPDGTVYVVDGMNHRIQTFTSEGAFLDAWGSFGRCEAQFSHPMGASFAPDGTIYVADTTNSRIQRFNSDGAFLTKWGTFGTANGEFDEPWGLGVAPDGTVYVADTSNHRVQRFSPSGAFLGKWGSRGSANGEFNGPTDVTVDANGNVYVADKWNSRIQKFTATGTFIARWGSSGTADGQFSEVRGIAVDGSGYVYATDFWGGRLQKFTSQGDFVKTWGQGSLGLPTSIGIDSQGFIYVGEGWGHRIQKFTSQGNLVRRWGEYAAAPGQFAEPSGVCITVEGDVLVADAWHGRIQKFDDQGRFVSQFTDFNLPRGVACDQLGFIYVADTENDRIVKMSSDGTRVLTWGTSGTGNGQFSHPRSLAAGPDGSVFVVDTGNHRIQHFSPTGQFIAAWGLKGANDGQFNEPSAIAVDPVGMVYVTDRYNHRVQMFSLSGQFLGKWGSFGQAEGQLNEPWGVAVAQDGSVYVVDHRNQRIQRFSASGQFLGKWGSRGSGNGQFIFPWSVASSPGGEIYITDAQRLHVFGPEHLRTWRGEFYTNRYLAEEPSFIQRFTTLAFQWLDKSPAPGLPIDGFSSRFRRTEWFESGTYQFTLSTDDNLRLWVDDRLLVDRWTGGQGVHISQMTKLSQGFHLLNVEHYDSGGPASLALDWQRMIDPTPTPASVRLPQVLQQAQATPTATVAPTPMAPELGLITPPEHNRSYAIRWSAVPAATSYLLEQAMESDFARPVQLYVGSATNFEVTSEGIATFYYRVKTRTAASESAWSNMRPVEVRWEREPNGEATEATLNGPLRPGQIHFGHLTGTDNRGNDYFFFDLPTSRSVGLWLTHMAVGQDFNLTLRNAGLVIVNGGHSGNPGNADEHISTLPLPAGRYYVQVSRVTGDSSQPYYLRAEW